MSDNIHRVRIHFWEDGVLQFTERLFHSLEEAVIYSHQHDHPGIESIKIYDPNDRMVHARDPNTSEASVYA